MRVYFLLVLFVLPRAAGKGRCSKIYPKTELFRRCLAYCKSHYHKNVAWCAHRTPTEEQRIAEFKKCVQRCEQRFNLKCEED
ncbi:hypothetical protein LSAT2_004008 [Lamellibrachia satsuma]|nr:hypothetical protein LSAT2_004008 [Lamellibrachia satsuma]